MAWGKSNLHAHNYHYRPYGFYKLKQEGHQIIEVNPNVVNAFLGRIEDPKSDLMLEGSTIPVINESAYRFIMYVCLKDYIIMKTRLTEEKALSLRKAFNRVLEEVLLRYKGSIVKDDGKRYIVSF